MTFDPTVFDPAMMIPLLAGHLLGDFVLQPEWMVEKKTNLGVALLHAGVVAGTAWLLTGRFGSWWWLLPALLVTHLVVDLAKAAGDKAMKEGRLKRSSARNGRVALFLLDQAAHLAVLVVLVAAAGTVAALQATVAGEGVWIGLFGATYLKLLVLVIGWLVSGPATGFFLGLVLARFEDELSPRQRQGLPGGGYWIGLTERSLIYLFILVGEPAGIGFLAAAKSVFRIGELKEAEERKLAEYILIGTLMSFSLAMVVGLLTEAVLALPTLRGSS